MRTNFEKLAMTLGSFLIVATLTATANASCGDKSGPVFHRQSWDLGSFNAGSLLLTSSNSDAIVGMWHVTLTAQGNQGGPPDGTPLDNPLVTWHSDGTEIMTSARPPQHGQS